MHRLDTARSSASRWKLCACLTLAACRAPEARVERAAVVREMHERAGVSAFPSDVADTPAAVRLDDGLTLDEAIVLALWHNPDLAAYFAELEVARSAVTEAGLLRDPVFTLLFPIGHKELESMLSLPIDAIWQRPRRIEIAQDDAERQASSLLQHGLDLVRDVQLGFAGLVLAERRALTAAEVARVRLEIARLEQVRVEAGDATSAAALDAAGAARISEELARFEGDRVTAARVNLAARVGSDGLDESLELEPPPAGGPYAQLAPDRLISLALRCRPDLRAAELDVESAAERLGLTREEAWRVSAILDANQRPNGGIEVGPGLAVTLPVFSGSRGTGARARADLDLAAARFGSTRARVRSEVLAAAAEFRSALRAREDWHTRIVPEGEQALEAIRRAHAGGDASALDELRAELNQLELSLREADALARVWRASAELEHSVGRRALASAEDQP